MTWDLEEAGDNAVTLHRDDGLVLSATRVADDAGTANRAHRWTEWRFAITDGGDQLTEHGWEIVDEEHLWEVLDAFTYRFRRDADTGTPADEREAAADGESADDPESPGEPNAAAARDAGDEQRTADSSDGSEPESDEDGVDSDGDVPAPTTTGSDESAPDDAMDVAAEAHAGADRNDVLTEGVGDAAASSDRVAADTEIATPSETNAAGGAATESGGTPSADRTIADPAPADAAVTEAQPGTAADSSPSADATAAETGDGARDDDPDVTYRPATPADADELAAVYRSADVENRERGFPAGAESGTADDVREWIEAHGLLVAVAGDEVVGGVRLQETGTARVKLSGLAVRSDWRRRGIGSELLDRAEAAVAAGNGERIWLTVPEPHPFLPEVYRERGYERTDEYPLEDRGDDEIVMEKRVG